MKAQEVLKRYNAGERNFQRVNLRGQSFKGVDLSEADFSEADIRSTNFTGAKLRGAKFCQAKAGLQRRWAIGLLLFSLLIAVFSGFCLSFVIFLVSLIFVETTFDKILGWLSLIILILLMTITWRKSIFAGFGVIAVAGIIAGIITGVITAKTLLSQLLPQLTQLSTFPEMVLPIITLTSIIVEAVAIGFTVIFAGAIATVVSGAVTAAIALPIPGAVAIAVTAASTTVIMTTISVPGLISIEVEVIVIAVIFMLFIAYITWRAWKGYPRDAWLRSFAVAFAAFGGTSFRYADLSDADFTGAKLKSTDLRGANLIRTRWRDTIMLDRVRPGTTYLNNAPIRQLLLTGDGKEQKYEKLVNLQGLNLEGAILNGANFEDSDLSESNLKGAILADTNFIRANLNDANLTEADLSRAKLVQTQLDQTDLTGATLTGGCIEDWGITPQTTLNGVKCDYIFMRLSPPSKHPHRKPDDYNKDFAEGEFIDFIQPLRDTLDLYHNNATDPRFALAAFQQLQENNPDADLELVSVEKKGKNRDKLLLRAETKPQANLSQLNADYFETLEYYLSLPPEAQQVLLIEKHLSEQKLYKLLDTRDKSININNIQQQGEQNTNIDTQMNVSGGDGITMVGKNEGEININE